MKPRPQKRNQTTKPTLINPNLRDQILADFTTLRVPVTADQFDAALTDAEQNNRSHLEFLHRLLTDQAGLRRQRRIERLIKDANFREALPLSTFDWNFNPAIPRLQIEALDVYKRQSSSSLDRKTTRCPPSTTGSVARVAAGR